MFDPKTFPLNVEQMTEFFTNNDFTKAFAAPKMPEVDGEAILAAQQKNMDALVEANKAAAAGYQDLFKKQIEVFETTLAAAQKQIAGFDVSKVDADSAKAQGEVAKVAFEQAITNMTALAEGAQKANAEAFEVVSARVQDSVTEMQDMAKKFSA